MFDRVLAWILEHQHEVGDNFMAKGIGKLRFVEAVEDGILFEKTVTPYSTPVIVKKSEIEESPILYCIREKECDLVQNAILNSDARPKTA